jgi:hypothetical protein
VLTMHQETSVWHFNLVVQSSRVAQTSFFTGMQKVYLGVLNRLPLEKREGERERSG